MKGLTLLYGQQGEVTQDSVKAFSSDAWKREGSELKSAEQKLLLTVEEVAARLSLGRTFVYELIMRGDIASIKIGRRRRIPVSAVYDFVKRQLSTMTGVTEMKGDA